MNYFLDFYKSKEEVQIEIYNYLFNLKNDKDIDILIKNSIYFYIEKDKYSIIMYLYLFKENKTYKFYDAREN